MDDGTSAISHFLSGMEPVRDLLGDFLRELYKRPAVKLVSIYHPEAYPSSSFGISTELRSGAVVDFWVELETKDSFWEMTYSVQRHDPNEDGSHSEADFPPERIESAADLPGAILAAVQTLRERSADDKLFK